MLQKAVTFEAFLTQQTQAFFRTTLEDTLGMKLTQARNWITLYQLFNQGPRILPKKTQKGITYSVVQRQTHH